MCGITGYFNPLKACEEMQRLHTATSLISHRGPDDEGYAVFNLDTSGRSSYVGPTSSENLRYRYPSIADHPVFPHHLAFGFRRFSIVDLSDNGHQPFWSQDKSICLIFNGEVYNYVEIRNELQKLGYSFLTTCDTEVLLVGYQAWGMDVLKRCNGPIAMVLYDSRKKRLFMARDRIGKSPLYYAIHQGTLYWASEIKAILSMTGRTAFPVNEQTVYDYLNFGWRDIDNTTFWDGIQTLKAASWVSLSVTESPTHDKLNASLHQYWDFPRERLNHKDIPFNQAVGHFRELFTDAVRIRVRADAKVGLSLSGGLDSSSIVAVAASSLPQQFRTYTVKFPGHECDEEPLARLVYEQYPDKIDYQTYIPGNKDFWDIANHYIWTQEEPFHYPSVELFQACLRKARADSYKVVLVGGGGDELLAGYHDYYFPLLKSLRQNNRMLPMAANLFLIQRLWPKYCIRKRLKILRYLLNYDDSSLRQYTPFSFFNRSGIEKCQKYILDKTMKDRLISRKNDFPKTYDQVAIGYMSNWLMNYWLRASDRSHLSVPVETRRPFLDHRLVEFTLTLPPEYLVNRGWTKFILRKAVKNVVPHKIIWNRLKRGMPFNSVEWFAHAKPIIEKHLDSTRDNPTLDGKAIMEDYDALVQSDPVLLWRCINYCLWWKWVFEKE